MKWTMPTIGGYERSATRVLAIVLGIFFVLGPIASPLFYEHQRHELATAGVRLLFVAAAVYLACAAVGFIFIAVGLKGRLPAWLAKRLKNDAQ